MKGYKGYELEKGYMGIVYGDYELFSDEKEYEDYMNRSKAEHDLPQAYVENYNAFSTDLLKLFETEKKKENIVFSPFSVLNLLGMAASVSAGETRKEILSAIFKGVEINTAISALKKLCGHFLKSGSLASANAVCVKPELRSTIQREYADALARDFSGRLFMSNNMVINQENHLKNELNMTFSTKEVFFDLTNEVSDEFEDAILLSVPNTSIQRIKDQLATNQYLEMIQKTQREKKHRRKKKCSVLKRLHAYQHKISVKR